MLLSSVGVHAKPKKHTKQPKKTNNLSKEQDLSDSSYWEEMS